jgi:hypothetical protein
MLALHRLDPQFPVDPRQALLNLLLDLRIKTVPVGIHGDHEGSEILDPNSVQGLGMKVLPVHRQ